MEVEYHSVKAQSVARCSRHLVDADFTVGMFDPIINGAYVNIRYSSPVTKVHSYTCRGAETLQKENKILSLTLYAQLFELLTECLFPYYLQRQGQVVNHGTAYVCDSLVLQPLCCISDSVSISR